MTLPVFAGVRVLGVDERRVASPGPTPSGPTLAHRHRGPLEGRITPRRWTPSRDRKNAIDDQLQDATSVPDTFHIVKLAGDAPGEVRRRVFHQDTPAQGQRLADTSSSAYQPVPSPKSLAWAGPYASGRTPSWPTSIPAEQATAPRKPSTDIIELGRRTAIG